ncbi:MAG: hypothetical protein AAF611_15210 [Bacteroidota bacterium]
MKKRDLKNLKLNKKSIANLDQVKGGNELVDDFTTITAELCTTIVPICNQATTLSCVLICVTKATCDN